VKLDLDLKTLITIVAFAATMGGFYYTTQSRLDSLETEVTQLQKQIKRLTRLNKK
jgi:peptidoglycan hydrolase CwlO-like protein